MGLQQHIAQLEVSMDDAKAVYVVHAFGYLLRRPQQCPLQSEIGTGIASKVLETMLTRSVKAEAQSASLQGCQCEDVQRKNACVMKGKAGQAVKQSRHAKSMCLAARSQM